MLSPTLTKRLSSLRILYVEDDFETREELKSILSLYIAELYVAQNGREGLELFQQHRPDIVVTDIQMPEMNGLSMAADIKHLNPKQAIVVLSAYNDVEYLFRALELEIQHYITKPISVERLLNKLSEISHQLHLSREVEQNRKLLEQYKLLVDEKAIVVKVDAKGQIIYVNQHFCELSGYSETELIGQHYLFTLDQNGQQNILDEMEQCLRDKHKWNGVLKKRTKDGAVYVVDVSVISIVEEADQPEEYIALMVDITEVYEKFERLSLNLKQDLNKQKHYLHEYEHALEVGTSLCVINPEGQIVSTNQNFSMTLDCTPEELIGRSFYDMVQNGAEFKERIMHKVLETGFSSRVIKITGKYGVQHTFSTVMVGIHDQEGKVCSLMSLNHDISETIRLNEDMIESQKDLIYVLGEIVENRSQETGMHIKRVALISELLARKYGLSEDYASMIKIASPLHDIGKIGIPDNILHKPGKLSEIEFQEMQKHADLGFHLLSKLDRPLIKMAATIAHEHHEHYNGKGYPLGLSGENIAIEARIVSLVDVFDALSTRRVYKEPWSDTQIIDYFMQHKGSQFDPELVDLFINNFDDILAIRDQFKAQSET